MLAAACVLLSMLVLAGSALADAPVAGTPFGVSTQGGANPTNVNRLAVDESTGVVYVIDAANDAVDEYSPTGTYLGQLNGSSTTAQRFALGGLEDGVAVDNTGGPTQGYVYVVGDNADAFEGSMVSAFDASGRFLWQQASNHIGATDLCGVSVDPSGNPWTQDVYNGIEERSVTDGTTIGLGPSPGDSCQIAFDSQDNLYLVHYRSSLQEYLPPAPFTPGNTIASGSIRSVATDWWNGDQVYTADGDQISAYDSTGAQISGTPFGSGVLGVAIDGAHDTIYGSLPGSSSVQPWTRAGASPQAYIHNADATAVGATGATLNGTVDPNGASATCEFVYVDDAQFNIDGFASARTQACDSAPGSGSSDVPVTGTLRGLAGSTLYHYQLVATNGNKPRSVRSMALTFTTGPTHTLHVSTDGNGSGTVTSAPAGIACGQTCGGTFDAGSTVRLSATPDTGSSFAGWSGGGCSGAGECDVALDADTTVTASFTLNGPSAVTGAASGVGQTTATIGGTVNPGGNATSCHFDYGTTTGYGSTAPCAPAPGSGTSPVGVGAALSGLPAGTVVHFRLVAVSAGGTSVGADATFSTTAPPVAAHVTFVSFTSKTLLLKLGCVGTAGQTCVGRLTYKAVIRVRVRHGHRTRVVRRSITVAIVSYRVAVGSTTRIRLRLTAAARSALRTGALRASTRGLPSIRLQRTKVVRRRTRRH